jgi:hypothetical protein
MSNDGVIGRFRHGCVDRGSYDNTKPIVAASFCIRNIYKAALVVMLVVGLQGSFIIRASAENDLQHCLGSRLLEDERRTEALPKDICPIRLGQSCYDKSHGLEVWNKCPLAIQIHIEAGTRDKWGSSTGEYTLQSGGNKQTFRCLEANGKCTSIAATVSGLAEKKERRTAVAQMTDGTGSADIFFIREGVTLPNQYGGRDLYYQKDGQWFVMRTNTKPQVPDDIATDSIKFYADPKSGFYVVGSSGDKWWISPAPQTKQ